MTGEADEAGYWRDLWQRTANGLLGALAETEQLRRDIERHVAIAATQATEIERLTHRVENLVGDYAEVQQCAVTEHEENVQLRAELLIVSSDRDTLLATFGKTPAQAAAGIIARRAGHRMSCPQFPAEPTGPCDCGYEAAARWHSCDRCHGANGGVVGNSNLSVNGEIICDYCHAKELAEKPQSPT